MMETVGRTYRVRVQHGLERGTDASEAPKAVRRVCTGFQAQTGMLVMRRGCGMMCMCSWMARM